MSSSSGVHRSGSPNLVDAPSCPQAILREQIVFPTKRRHGRDRFQHCVFLASNIQRTALIFPLVVAELMDLREARGDQLYGETETEVNSSRCDRQPDALGLSVADGTPFVVLRRTQACPLLRKPRTLVSGTSQCLANIACRPLSLTAPKYDKDIALLYIFAYPCLSRAADCKRLECWECIKGSSQYW